jgi:hypothetical protein
MAPYVSTDGHANSEKQAENSTSYDLFAILVHKGVSAYGGSEKFKCL